MQNQCYSPVMLVSCNLFECNYTFLSGIQTASRNLIIFLAAMLQLKNAILFPDEIHKQDERILHINSHASIPKKKTENRKNTCLHCCMEFSGFFFDKMDEPLRWRRRAHAKIPCRNRSRYFSMCPASPA